MSRVIKFRAWAENSKRMRALNPQENFFLSRDLVDEPGWCVMQFTGIRDKNGTEIYEGDIVQSGYVKHEVVFELGSFRFKNASKHSMPLGLEPVRFEVIGNVWENPNLLAA